ncbi:MAG: discoidin domain-containing protein [Bacteroidaceae bacterium]|nr:discoidin domain-containing protein [Bacteroidaceae bacterium]
MRKIKFFLGLVLTMLAANVFAQNAEDGTYYLYNEESDLFYSRAANWGTAAVGDVYGYPVNLAFTDNVSKIIGADWTNTGLGANLFYDNGSPVSWTFTPSGGGYVIGDATLGQLKVNGEKVQLSFDPQGSVWKLYSKEQYEKRISDRYNAAKQKAMSDAGITNLENTELVDMTDKVKSAALAGSVDGWTKAFETSRGEHLVTNENGTESYERSGSLTQKVTGLEKGLYWVTIQAFYRNGSCADCVTRAATGYIYSTAYLKANGIYSRIKDWASDRVSDANPNSMPDASAAFADGKYLIDCYCYVGDNGELELQIGWPSFIGGGWFICKNLKLYQVKPLQKPEGKEVAIDRSNWSISAYAAPGSAIENANDGRITAAIDGNTSTFFHSDWKTGTGNGCPQSFLVDMGKEYEITKISFLPRQNGDGKGAIVNGRVYVYSADEVPFTDYSAITADNKAEALSAETLGAADLDIEWENKLSTAEKTASFATPAKGRYILVVADETTSNNNDRFLCCSEFNAFYIAQTADVKYTYTIDGTTFGEETFTVAVGSNRPTPKTAAPFKCTFDFSGVPATINASAEYTIPVVVGEDFPFEFSTSYDDAKWYTWRMRSGYAGFDGTNFPETASDSQPTNVKNMFAFVGSPVAFKVLTPMDKNLFLAGNDGEKATVTDEGATFYIHGMNDTEYTFAIDGKNGTVNDVQKSVGFWGSGNSYTDAGSKIYIDEAVGVQLYKVAFGEGSPESASVTLNGETLTPASVVKAFAVTSTPSLEDFQAAEIKYFKSELTLTGKTLTVNYVTTRPAEWVALGNLIAKAEATTLPTDNFGTDPGFYNQAAVEAFPAAIASAKAVHEFEYETEEEAIAAYNEQSAALSAAIASIQPLMPQVGKTYQLIIANPDFERLQGHKKAMYSDGTGLLWKQKDDTDKSFYWTVTAVDGQNVTFQNYGDGKYPKGYTTANQTIPVQDEPNYCLITSLGQGQFNITSNGSSAAFHAGDHSNGAGKNGRVMVWNAGLNSSSAWYIHETTDIMDFVEKVAEQVGSAKELSKDADKLIDAFTAYPYEWTTSTEQFSSNRPCPSEGNLNNLLDNNATTFFHSDWSGTFPNGAGHELYVSGLDAGVTKYDLYALRRSGAANDHVTQMEVYGGTVKVPENPNTQAAEFTIESGEEPLAIIDIPFVSGQPATASFDLGETGYEALCFRVTNTTTWNAENRGYFHFGDFHLFDQNRVIPAEYDIPATFKDRVIAKFAALNALLAEPVLSEEYAVLVEAAMAEAQMAYDEAVNNINYNRTFAGNTSTQVQITAGVKGSKGRVSVAFPEDEIVSALGVPNIDEAKQLTIDGLAGYKQNVAAKYITETGYRDINGKVCEKKEAAVQTQLYNGQFYVTPVVELDVTTPAINIYTVYTGNDKAYLFLVKVNVVAAEGDGATAIDGVNATVGASGIIYDLMGRKVSSVKRGQIYIVGGQKVMF